MNRIISLIRCSRRPGITFGFRKLLYRLLTTTAFTYVKNRLIFYLLDFLRIHYLAATIAAWFVSVLFAYLTNRKWVFHSEASTRKEILRESVSFFLCRLGTGVLDWVLMYLLVDCLHRPDLWVKIGVNVVVILLNYVASKLLIFRHKP